MNKLDFYLAGQPVGHFLNDYPTTPGRYEYDPYRGEGHAELAQALKQGKTAVCSFTTGWKTVRLLITAKELVEYRWHIQVSEIWVRPRALVLLLVWLAVGIAILVWGTQ